MNLIKPIIYLITDGSLDSDNYPAKSQGLREHVKTAVDNKISLIQIREKKLPARLLFQITNEIVQLAKNSTTKILVNDRADVAFAAKADGVHLTSNSISPSRIRKFSPEGFLIGVSAHNLEEVISAKEQEADFAVFSPIFYTENKGAPQGIEKLNQVVVNAGKFPVIALGGIDEQNFAAALNTGASGIAAIKLLNDIEKLPEIIRKINGESDE